MIVMSFLLLSVDRVPASLLPVTSVVVFLSVVLVLTAILLVLFLYLHSPDLLLSLVNAQINLHSGLRSHQVVLPSSSHTVHFLAGGQRTHPLVLLVHGFGMDSSMWAIIASRLIRRGYYVVAPDLVGFGQTLPVEADSYSFEAQVRRLAEFADAVLDGRRFHIGGTSMGGAIAGIFAAEYPEKVLSAWLLCPAGILSSHTSAFCDKLRQNRVDGNLLLSHTVEDMRDVFTHLFHRPPYVPEGVFRAWAKEKAQRMPVQRRAMEHLTADDQVLLMHHRLGDLRVPLCVAWGRYDEILDVSCVDVIRRKVTAVEPDILLVESGHAITVEQSRVVTKHYLAFVDRLERHNPSSVSASSIGATAAGSAKAAPDMPEHTAGEEGGAQLTSSSPSFLLDHLDAISADTPRDATTVRRRTTAGGEDGEKSDSGEGTVKVDKSQPSETSSAVEAAAISTS